jgi:hypothetical protein
MFTQTMLFFSKKLFMSRTEPEPSNKMKLILALLYTDILIMYCLTLPDTHPVHDFKGFYSWTSI